MTRLLFLLAIACSDPPAPTALTLATQYDAVGVVRVFPDGLTPMYLDTFGLSFGSVQSSAGRAVAMVERKGLGAMAIPLSGTFEEDSGDLQFDPVSGSLTSTRPESIAIAGTAEDGFPEDDGVADHVTGFIRAEIDLEVREGQMLAVSPQDLRPPPIDESKVSATALPNGTVEIAGEAGAALPGVGVEILRFTVSRKDPDFKIIEANTDGSFSISVMGVLQDVFLVRVSPAGRKSDARVVRPHS